ncbi:MAG: trypsin-like peptidase domain-containing protein [bacterium]|nr:trypsin-like peptidase domain-containing protein [bacterium]
MHIQNLAGFDFSVAEIDRELVAGAFILPEEKRFKFHDSIGTPQRDEIFKRNQRIYSRPGASRRNPALSFLSPQELLSKLQLMLLEKDAGPVRGIWFEDGRIDVCESNDPEMTKNARSLTLVLDKKTLTDTGNGFSTLAVKNYGKAFNLSVAEPFYNQPIVAHGMCSGVLVGDDVVATTTHFVEDVKHLTFVFDFCMADSTPVTVFPNHNIYRAKEILHRFRDVDGPEASGADWALVRLDRKVKDREIARPSKNNVFYEQEFYTIGHPCGLPAKIALGSSVNTVNKAYFSAYMDVFSGNSGSPVFDAQSHELIGIVSRGDYRDFRWVGDSVVSVLYPNPDIHSEGARVVKIKEFLHHLS